MKNTTNFIVFVVCWIFFLGCSNSDNNSITDEEITLIPSSFTVTVDSIGFDLATVSWAKPAGANNENLVYSILLNNNQIAQGITELTYAFDDLEVTTNYEIDVVAANANGMTIAATNFKTLNPEDYTILLKEYFTENDDEYLRYFYNSGNSVIRRTIGSANYVEYDHSISYDSNLDIDFVDVNNSYTNQQGYLEYDYTVNQDLEKITAYYWDGECWKFIYDYSSPDTFRVSSTVNNTPNCNIIFVDFEVTLERDAQGRIIEAEFINANNQVSEILLFEYRNGNLVAVNEVKNNVVWNIEYDTMKSFYVPGVYEHFPPFRQDFFIGLLSVPIRYIKSIPELGNYSNSNNPVKVFRNDDLYVSHEYEYHPFGYPSKVNTTYIIPDPEPKFLNYIFIKN